MKNQAGNILFYLSLILITLTASIGIAMNKKLPLCPNSPNCVSSQANTSDATHFIAPFKMVAEPEQIWAALKQALTSQSRTIIVREDNDSLEAKATSLIFRFVDDIQIILDKEQHLIQIRSASRVGYGDFGVNRKRLEQLRTQLQQAKLIE
jgi:uncharacterized protein (DUF1499 family)